MTTRMCVRVRVLCMSACVRGACVPVCVYIYMNIDKYIHVCVCVCVCVMINLKTILRGTDLFEI